LRAKRSNLGFNKIKKFEIATSRKTLLAMTFREFFSNPLNSITPEGNYSGQPLRTGAKKLARDQQESAAQPKQRVRSESAAGVSIDSITGKKHTGKPCAETKRLA